MGLLENVVCPRFLRLLAEKKKAWKCSFQAFVFSVCLAPPVRFELTTNGLTVRCATAAPQGNIHERKVYFCPLVGSRLDPAPVACRAR